LNPRSAGFGRCLESATLFIGASSMSFSDALRCTASKRSRCRPSHGSPYSFAAFPQTPFHRCVLVHLGVLEIFFCKLVFSAELLIRLILLRSTYVRLIVSRVRENVIIFLALLDHRHLAGLKILELLFLRGRFRSDDLKSGGHEHAFSVL